MRRSSEARFAPSHLRHHPMRSYSLNVTSSFFKLSFFTSNRKVSRIYFAKCRDNLSTSQVTDFRPFHSRSIRILLSLVSLSHPQPLQICSQGWSGSGIGTLLAHFSDSWEFLLQSPSTQNLFILMESCLYLQIFNSLNRLRCLRVEVSRYRLDLQWREGQDKPRLRQSLPFDRRVVLRV